MQSIKVLKTKHVLNMQTVFLFLQTIPNICSITFVEHVKAYSAVLMLFP